MPNAEFPITRVYVIIAILYCSLMAMSFYGIYDNNQRRAEAIRNAQIERAASKQEILDRIEAVQKNTTDRFHKSDMERWLKKLQETNPDVNVPAIPAKS